MLARDTIERTKDSSCTSCKGIPADTQPDYHTLLFLVEFAKTGNYCDVMYVSGGKLNAFSQTKSQQGEGRGGEEWGEGGGGAWCRSGLLGVRHAFRWP